jgi:glycosyltransferase involved in cell wall biosynthesis
MNKLAIIHRSGKSDWKSCQNITENLNQAHRSAFRQYEIKEFYTNQDFNSFTAFTLARDIKEWGATKIAWLDHKPHPALLIKGLNFVYAQVHFEDRPLLLVHLFGDFVLDCLGWQTIQDEIHQQPIHFLTASHAHKSLIDNLIKINGQHTSVLAFPVNTDFFSLKNIEYVQKCKIKYKTDNKKIYLYTGRISYQKNISELILLFQSLKDHNTELWLAGAWDNIYFPYTGKAGITGSFHSQLQTITSYQDFSNVRFLGQLQGEELIEAYHAADVFISLSTYHDEDFGMSPAEAICTGLPCLLSSWGGYKSFKDIYSDIITIPTFLEDERPTLNFTSAQKTLFLQNLAPISKFGERQARSLKGIKALSINTCAEGIQAIIEKSTFKPIAEFTKNFDTLCAKFRTRPSAPFADPKGNLSKFYKDLYNCYAT